MISHIMPRSRSPESKINPQKYEASKILPIHSDNVIRCTILPKSQKIIRKVSSGYFWVIGIAIAIGIYIYGYGYNDFKTELQDNDWGNVDYNDGSYYKRELSFSENKIDYRFEAWIINTRIHEFNYKIIAPGVISADGDIYKIKIDDDVMEISPALTSADSSELWFKG